MDELLSWYRKRPIEIRAVQWTGNNTASLLIAGLVDGITTRQDLCGKWDTVPYIETLEGRMIVSRNDWVIVGVAGERYPCKDNIFQATYDAIVD